MKNGERVNKAIAYIHGRIEAEIEAFAKSLNISSIELTARVGALLLGTSSWETLGVSDSVPNVRGRPTEGSETVEPVAMASGPHRRTSGSKSYWEKMTPAQRSAEIKRRMRKWTPEAKTKWRGRRK